MNTIKQFKKAADRLDITSSAYVVIDDENGPTIISDYFSDELVIGDLHDAEALCTLINTCGDIAKILEDQK